MSQQRDMKLIGQSKVAVKICGIPNIAIASQVIACSPDAIGIYCWDDKALGKNITTMQEAAHIATLAKKNSVQTFYLTYAKTAVEVIAAYQMIGFSHVQLIGDIPISEIEKIKKVIPDLITVKVIGVIGQESIAYADTYAVNAAVDQLLLDSKIGKIGGGTGKTHDWTISAEIVKKTHSKKVWLAGGLNTTNVHTALDTVHPTGIDVETGVQHADGTKDYEKIKQFIGLVHQASAAAKPKAPLSALFPAAPAEQKTSDSATAPQQLIKK